PVAKSTGSGISRPPSDIPEDERTDNNFTSIAFGDGESRRLASERFYLWSSDRTDMTKDLGLVPYRDLEIRKVSQESDDPIPGTEFTVYGPFEPETGAAADLTRAPVADTVTTDENGRAVAENLLYFMEYVVVET